MPIEFPEYSLKMSRAAQDQRSKLPAEFLPTLGSIIDGLASDPRRYPDRVTPASRDGRSLVYMHPAPLIQVTFELDPEQKVLYVLSVAALGFKTRKTIFMSYSREDQEWLDLLKKFLTVLEQQGIIEIWDDSKIQAGADWRAAIQEALDSCKAALLLVSQDFLTSKFIKEVELPKLLADAQAKGKKIFWIPVRASTVLDSHKEISRFQSLLRQPETSLQELAKPKREKALVQISKTLATVVSSGNGA
ncbi:MAG: toll/interleukin-1 receptor domain-containing protein [Gemmatimonadales bacterium]